MVRFGKAYLCGAVLLLVGAVTTQPVTTAAKPDPPATTRAEKPPQAANHPRADNHPRAENRPRAAKPVPVRKPAGAEKFSIVVIPDTQYSAARYPAAFKAQTTWIRNNRRPHNIRYVVHAGDIVDNAAAAQQWSNASAALARLDGNTPYILAVGNHDMDAMPRGRDPAAVRATTAFNRVFPVGRFAAYALVRRVIPRRAQRQQLSHLRRGRHRLADPRAEVRCRTAVRSRGATG